MHQSALQPSGPAAGKIAGLWWLLFGIGAFVMLAVTVLLGIALLPRRERARPAPPLGNTGFVVVSGILVPAVFLVTMLFASLKATLALRTPANVLTVRVIGHQWWWEVHYPHEGIKTANEIEIPAGQPVRLELDSADVIHSFWVPSLNGKMDLIPGHPNIFWIAADRPGTYRGQCAEYCGAQHAHMAFFVVALPPRQFQAWVASKQRTRPPPKDAARTRGRQVFLLAGCADCHSLKDTGATGTFGPDLTHVASRLTLGAGTLLNTPGNLEGWIGDSQAAKPGNRMPRMYLPPQDLHAIRDYLESLD